MDSNDETARGLQERTSRLSEILEQFKDQSFEPERATTTKLINDLQRYVFFWCSATSTNSLMASSSELNRVRGDVQQLQLGGTFRRVFSSDEHAGQLQEWETKIQRALDEMQVCYLSRAVDPIHSICQCQLLLNINTADRVTDLCQYRIFPHRLDFSHCLTSRYRRSAEGAARIARLLRRWQLRSSGRRD